MRLDEYLAQNKLSQAEFGEKLHPSVTQGLVSQWCRGDTRITLDNAIQIEELTAGQVTVRDCHAMYSREAA
ncbi:hypothetical protein OTERR_12760 [Oryzomicrobium terrae]|uniref:HTH cro/C1-type domain-containing protein n=1 Tax=Oryzomicrobium terrae TaxID=1735038 RepID=A0A5C1E722_9RHOO|nr:helix-turn-helix domain-containing protein [Oryzomicrobium terrae]QEL64752.1 hypothetical protein OTERR_12760 [Oryzomicrobium terrae]